MRNLKSRISRSFVLVVACVLISSLGFSKVHAEEDECHDSNADEFEMLSYDAKTGSTYISYFKNVVKDPDVELVSPANCDVPIENQQLRSPTPLSHVSNANISPYYNVVMCRNGFDIDNNGVIETWTITSGAFVYNDLVFTCAHGIYWYAQSKTANVVQVYKALNSSSLPNTYYSLSGWHIPTQFTSSADSDYDWAVLVTSSTTSTWFGYGYASNISNKSVNSAGYVDQPSYYYLMQESPGTMSSTSSYRFSSTMYTIGGRSGSAAFDSNGIVWGELQSHISGYYGYGCLVTSQVYSVLEALK